METFFSQVLEIRGKLEMGQRRYQFLGSKPVFFHAGVTAAGLKTVGRTGVVSGE